MPSGNQRVVVITGVTSGIGRATAHAFARRGDAVEGGWRGSPDSGGVPLAAATSLAALPIEGAMRPFRMADAGLTAAARMMEALVPPGLSGPVSK